MLNCPEAGEDFHLMFVYWLQLHQCSLLHKQVLAPAALSYAAPTIKKTNKAFSSLEPVACSSAKGMS